MVERVILHVDMDAFFAAIEQRERVEYQGKPVVVGADPKGGRGRGVVAACSYEARAFGLHSAMPISRAYRLCPEAIFLPPNRALYLKVSKSVMAILSRYTDLVEPISIDEAFLDVSGSLKLFGSPKQIARRIKADISKEQSLSCSIGIASNKFIAKIASDMRKPNGLLAIPAGSERGFLRSLSTRHIWGVGPKTEAQLRTLGVFTIGEIAAKPLEFWQDRLGKQGVQLWRLSQGIDSRAVTPQHEPVSLSQEITFVKDSDDAALLQRTLLALSEKLAARARKQGVRARTLQLKLRTADFSTYTRRVTLRRPSSDATQIYEVMKMLLAKFTQLPSKVRLLGVGMAQLTKQTSLQPGLFDQPPTHGRLEESLDEIRAKFGDKSIVRASLLADAIEDESSAEEP